MVILFFMALKNFDLFASFIFLHFGVPLQRYDVYYQSSIYYKISLF